MIKPRKIPLRICLGCSEKKPKRELVRIVRTPQGEVVLDLTGKKAGRGAYICPNSECLKKALKGKRLEKNLQHPLSPGVVDEIIAYLEAQERSEA
ncbi:MAG TPA: YlxR family protein [Bacillota bacterium]|nr:YlxR family protein [Bacillota bacterium]